MVWHSSLVARNRGVIESREAGMTLREVASRFGLSRERVRQITLNARRDQPVPVSQDLPPSSRLSKRARVLLEMMRYPDRAPWGYRLIGRKYIDRDGDGFYLQRIPNFARKTVGELLQAGLIEAKYSTGLMRRDIESRYVAWRLVRTDA